ncbi:MAG TPA: prepilin-type N-terminal cleavage/methylation domain-containing protein [Gemmatimonadales bacterium]
MRNGTTLVEMLTVLIIMGVLAGWAVPKLNAWADWIAVESASREVAAFYSAARFAAAQRGTRIRVQFAEDSLRAVFEGRHDSVFRVRPGPRVRGVSLHASQAVVRIGSSGYGWAAGNTTVVMRRGAFVDSLIISRLGRLRWR